MIQLANLLGNLQIHGWISQKFLGLRMRHFQDIVFIWTQTYMEIFKSALVYLYVLLIKKLYLKNNILIWIVNVYMYWPLQILKS